MIMLELKAIIIVSGWNAHALLAHGALQGVLCCLIVIRKGDKGGTDAKHHRRMDLAMCVLVSTI